MITLRLASLSIMRKIAPLLFRSVKITSRKGLYEFLEEEFETISAGATVLNIGSGGPTEEIMGKYVQRKSFRIISLDIDADRKPNIVGDICTCLFDAESFDVVVMSEVLEHVHSPHMALDNIREFLKCGGKLIMTVPFIFPIHDSPYDYYRFTKYGLYYLLRRFSVVTVKERNTWAEAINVIPPRMITEKSLSARLATPIFIILSLLFLPIAALLGWLIKTDYITTGYNVVAVK